MEKIKTENAVGKILGSDVTEIVPGVKKGPLFKRGHIIKNDDIEKLLSIGKHYVWVFSKDEGFIHEDDAALTIMKAVSGKNLRVTEPSESKVKLIAEKDGVLFINEAGLLEVNSLKDTTIATKRSYSFVRGEEPIAIGKVMPVEVPVSEVDEVKMIAQKFYPIINLVPLKTNKIAIYPVGNEFVEGRRKEVLSFRVADYLSSLGQSVERKNSLPDDESKIKEAGISALKSGFNIVIYMGGLAVDPDDKTVSGIRKIGVTEVTYGVPMWPGTTFFISYKDDNLLLGIPSAAGLVKSDTSFHRLMPILLTGYKLSRLELMKMACGGFINAKGL